MQTVIVNAERCLNKNNKDYTARCAVDMIYTSSSIRSINETRHSLIEIGKTFLHFILLSRNKILTRKIVLLYRPLVIIFSNKFFNKKTTVMKTKIYALILIFLALSAGKSFVYAAPNVKLTSTAVAASNVNQGTINVLVYTVKMKVTSAAVTVNNIQFTLSGTFDNNDLVYARVYYNTVPTIGGASQLTYALANFAAPHTFSLGLSKAMNAGDSGYFMIAVDMKSDATDGHTVTLNGATNPIVFSYSIAVNLTNSQTNAAGAQTIKAATVKLSTNAVPASTDNQGTINVLVYTVKMKVSVEPVTVNNIQFTLSGTNDANDLVYARVYFNTSPVLSGASQLTYSLANYAGPHLYSLGLYKPMNKGDSGYFMIAVDWTTTATNGKYVKVTGATTPVSFGFTTAPNVTGTQTNGNNHTVQAANVKLSTIAVPASTDNQGTINVLVYTVKMKVTTQPVTVNNIQFTLSGTNGASDLVYARVYFNTTPYLSGASQLTYSLANYAAPHLYSLGLYKPMNKGDSGYFMIAIDWATTATNGKYVKVTGATTPVTFGFTTAPTVTGTKTNGNNHTVQAANVKLSTTAVPASTDNQGTINVLVYTVKMKVTLQPITVNNIQFTLSGNNDANDLVYARVYFNTTPTLSGASQLTYSLANYAAPHLYSLGLYKPMNKGDSGYFMIAIDWATTATDGKNVKVTGSTTPVAFGFTTAPTVTGTQTNGNTHTVQAADVTLSSNSVAAGNIARSSMNNVVYITKAVIATEPITINNVQFTLTGTHDNDDLVYARVYFNTAPNLSGASQLTYALANNAAPHTYSVGAYKPMAIGDVGYFLIAVDVASAATVGHTVTINGNTNPVVFGYTTVPNITNNQTNAAGVKTISASAPNSFSYNENSKADVRNEIVSANVYPNPATDAVNIKLSFEAKQQVTLQLTTESGNVLTSKTFMVEKGNNKLSMDTHALFNGVYYVTLQSAGKTFHLNKKVLVRH